VLTALLLGCRCGAPDPHPHAGDPTDATHDADADGFSTPEDCDDADPDVFPGAPDVPYDGVDSDCAGDDDFDADHDGAARDADCDDADPLRFPENIELLCDQVDGDCDGEIERAASCAIGVDAAFTQLDTEGAGGRIAPDLTGDGSPDLIGFEAESYGSGHSGGDLTVLELWAQDGAGVSLAATVRSSGVTETDYSTRRGVFDAMPAGDGDGDGEADDLWVLPRGSVGAYLLAGPLSGDIDLEAAAVSRVEDFNLRPPDDVDGDGFGDTFAFGHVYFGPWDAAGPAREVVPEVAAEVGIHFEGGRAMAGLTADGFGVADPVTGALLAEWKGQFSFYVVAADTNGDGYEDFAFNGEVYDGPVADGVRPDPSVVIEDNSGSFFVSAAAGDVEGDGAAEIALETGNTTYVVHASAPGTFVLADVSYALPEGVVSIGPWYNPRSVVAIAGYDLRVDLFDLSAWPVE
jgi:hypothetical protein